MTLLEKVLGVHILHASERSKHGTYFQKGRPGLLGRSESLRLITGGKAFFKLGGKSVSVRRGDLLRHDGENPAQGFSSPKRPVSYMILGVRLVSKDGERVSLGLSGVPSFLETRAYSDIRKAFRNIIRTFEGGKQFYLPKCSVLGLQLIRLLHNEIFKTKKIFDRRLETVDKRIGLVLDYLSEHYKKMPTLAFLASKASLHPVYFHRLFKQRVGVTPHRYLMDRKIFKAKESLRFEKDETAETIGRELGFSDYSHFFRAFKKATGMSPRAFGKTQEAASGSK